MRRNPSIMIALIAAALVAPLAGAAIVNTTITADNHYALYADGPGGIVLIGGNELGSGGSPGIYNWSLPESFSFETLNHVYIAVWSDDAVAQGLLADMASGDVNISTGVAGWEVMMTDQNLGDGSPRPLAAEIQSWVTLADMNALWQAPFVGGANIAATGPWGKVPGISDEARWTWGNPDDKDNPLVGGASHEEFQIFRMSNVPAPGGAVAIGLAGIVLIARRRR